MYVCDKLQGCSLKNVWVINILYFVCIQFGNIAGAVVAAVAFIRTMVL